MNQLPPAIRKAAVLISALDDRAADALLDQMDAETAARVRSAIMALGDVPAAEQQAVLAEFLRGQSPAASAPANDPGVELATSLAERMEEPLPMDPPRAAPTAPLDFLRNVPPREISHVLAREHQQTIAVVLSRLGAELAAQVLEQLPAAQATDVLERLAWLELPSPDVLADIERQLRAELAPFLRTAAGANQSLASVQALVGAMDLAARERVLAGLGQRNGALARQLGYLQPPQLGQPASVPDNYEVTAFRYRIERQPGAPAPLVEFDDFSALGDDALRRILAAAEPQVALLALTGADEALVGRILAQLPNREAALLRQRLNHPGAVRLADIQAAQEQLAAVARRLAAEGTIVLPSARRFAAAA